MNRGLTEFAKYGSIGIAWVLSTSIYMYLGFKGGTWLDDKFQSAPLFMVLGLVVGIALSMQSLVMHITEVTKAMDADAGSRRKNDVSAVDRENDNNN